MEKISLLPHHQRWLMDQTYQGLFSQLELLSSRQNLAEGGVSPLLVEYWNRDHNAKRLRLYHGLGPGNGGTTSTSYSRWPNVRSDAGRPCGEVGSYKHAPSIFGTPHLHPTHPRTHAFHPHSHCVGSIVFRVYVRGVVPRN